MQTTPLPAARNTPWSTHPGYDLSRYTVVSDAVNDRDRHHPGTVLATVAAMKFTGHQNACVRIDLSVGPADMQVRMSPEKARDIAQAILNAADIVDQFTAHQAEERELARYNAGPVNRIELNGGVVAFEPAEGGAA